MRNPIVIAYHLIWTAYGTWLPNDPRGSGSTSVLSDLLAELGELHFGRRKIQPAHRQVREFYNQAEPRLRFPVIRYDEANRNLIANGIANAITEHTYTCYACAVMPDHMHLLIRKHRHLAEDMIENIQAATRLRLSPSPTIPANHPIWTEGGWKVFLDSPDRIRAVVSYIEKNPIKAKLLPQNWPFVTQYNGWPFAPKRG
jgi:REP element-mobilizing transposase RayT